MAARGTRAEGAGRAPGERGVRGAAEAGRPGRAGRAGTAGGLARDAPALAARRVRGRAAHHQGRAAEGVVARHYARLGLGLVEARWRGRAGEIDLVLRSGDGVVFVEVKAARDHAQAARALTPRQAARLLEAGAEYLGTQPLGQLTEARFDVALVDRSGTVEIIENALGQ